MTDDQDLKPGDLNYESPLHKALRYAAMPVTIPLAVIGFVCMAIKYSVTGQSNGDGPP
jgi:hypothetical protein